MLFAIDVPYTPPVEVPIVLTQTVQAGSDGPTSVSPDFLLQQCTEANNDDEPLTAMNGIDPGTWVQVFIENNREHRPLDRAAFSSFLLTGPSHGRLIEEATPNGIVYWMYQPEPDFLPEEGYSKNPDLLAKDQATFLVIYAGKTYKVVVDIHVFEQVNERRTTCSDPKLIEIKRKLPTPTGLNDDGISVTIAALDGGALAQVSGSTITLDSNAAGHSWFIDPTPGDNSEFLPTSNPNEWIAREGSAAYGKMDLLTVLLHEYGHVLGIEHSPDAHDTMSATLQPGVRRTLTVDQQLELMALAGYFPVPDSPSTPYGPSDPGAPLPFTRTTNNRLARRPQTSSDDPTQFATLANAKLANPDFTDGTGWTTQGEVAFASGSATLKEGAATQTRLNQVFVVGDHDRFLSFTLAGQSLGDQAAGPDDAFEVALLDANTGAALLGGTGLTRSDAFLNLQANGNERASSAVTRLTNADGSRTYLVDLAGVAAGTVVNLSFDLIGFGKGIEAANSRVTVRDLRLGVPQTADDAVAGTEDTPLAIDALANDLNAQQPGFAPVVVEGPAHGTVSFGADGQFHYTPVADWNGEDAFTYKLSDGVVDSNLATVTVTVAAVNDAPTLANQSLATDEDTPLSGSLLATAGRRLDRSKAGPGMPG